MTSICLTQDSSKAIVGCVDSKVYIYNVHSGKVEKTITDSNGEVTSVRLTEKDDFLLKGGEIVIKIPSQYTTTIYFRWQQSSCVSFQRK